MQPLVFDYRKMMFIEKYGALIADKLISPEQVFGVVRLKQMCRCVRSDAPHTMWFY